MNQAVISLRDVSYTYPSEETPALDGLTFDIAPGEWVALVGSNGSGKSTLARLLNALLLPTRGDVFVCGMNSADESQLWEIRRRLSMVFQNPDNQIVSSLVEDDVAFGPENLGIPPKEIREKVDRALEIVGLKDLAHREVYTLSGGQKQRLAIAGALAMESDCLVLDEPTAMLDPQGRLEVMGLLKDLKKRGLTLVQITHHIDEIEQVDRVIVLEKGRYTWEGTPEELLALSDLHERFKLYKPAVHELHDLLVQRQIIDSSVVAKADALLEALCPLN